MCVLGFDVSRLGLAYGRANGLTSARYRKLVANADKRFIAASSVVSMEFVRASVLMKTRTSETTFRAVIQPRNIRSTAVSQLLTRVHC